MKILLAFLLALAACGDDFSTIDPMPDAGAAIDTHPMLSVGVRYVCTIRAHQEPGLGPVSTDTVCAPLNNFDLASDRAADANPDHDVLGCVDTQYDCPQ